MRLKKYYTERASLKNITKESVRNAKRYQIVHMRLVNMLDLNVITEEEALRIRDLAKSKDLDSLSVAEAIIDEITNKYDEEHDSNT